MALVLGGDGSIDEEIGDPSFNHEDHSRSEGSNGSSEAEKGDWI